ncbi:MAG: 50S ribosomal protein L3 [Candidatus Omnitrophota bacterium]
MIGILGKKIGITQIFADEGVSVPVTVIESEPCAILQIKSIKTDGYNAIQLGSGAAKEKNVAKPQLEKFKKINVAPKRFVREILVKDVKDFTVGQNIDLTQFNPGDYVHVIATSIGRGFQGGVKRWHWRGGPATHGSMSHRAPGSIGSNTTPGRVFKGHKMPGHMGNRRVTVKNLEVIKVDTANNLLVLKGSVPGHINSFLMVLPSTKKKRTPPPKPVVKKETAPRREKAPAQAKPAGKGSK